MPKKQKSDRNFLISASTSRSPDFLGTTVYNYNIKPLAGNSSGEKMGEIFEKIVEKTPGNGPPWGFLVLTCNITIKLPGNNILPRSPPNVNRLLHGENF